MLRGSPTDGHVWILKVVVVLVLFSINLSILLSIRVFVLFIIVFSVYVGFLDNFRLFVLFVIIFEGFMGIFFSLSIVAFRFMK